MNLFPILAALGVIAFPVGAMSRSVGYFAGSFLATAAYVVCLAGLIRVARALR